ncbi:MAG: hypothetical protein INR71_03955 [Terriglobus roseus]|nr:hypothetical protein [Terriglobus roseus]
MHCRIKMGKRKRDQGEKDAELPNGKASRPISEAASSHHSSTLPSDAVVIQIVTGSYERALHGIVARVPVDALKTSDSTTQPATFSDSFLFNAHTSSIRCLALSPPSEAQKVFLATGSTDERVNLYSLSTVPPSAPHASKSDGPDATEHSALSSLSHPTATNRANKEIGVLNHHSATVTCLSFPTRAKLLSSAADNSIAVLRTRDWEVLSSLRAPIPKPAGRPSGDTATPGEVPAGINDVAVHPSLKLMVTVGRGEKCMRLWNLVTGKKAGVLQFDKSMLAQVGEGRHSSGEGRRAVWDADGEEFVIAFERGACVFGIDSTPKAVVRPQPPTKLHQVQYLPAGEDALLVVSTEDGRLLFYNPKHATADTGEQTNGDAKVKKEQAIPRAPLVGQLGGRDQAVGTRIKDFVVLPVRNAGGAEGSDDSDLAPSHLTVTACSDGAVQVWALDFALAKTKADDADVPHASKAREAPQLGALLGTYQTGNRITCMAAFVMTGKPDADVDAATGGLETVATPSSSESEEGSSDSE